MDKAKTNPNEAKRTQSFGYAQDKSFRTAFSVLRIAKWGK